MPLLHLADTSNTANGIVVGITAASDDGLDAASGTTTVGGASASALTAPMGVRVSAVQSAKPEPATRMVSLCTAVLDTQVKNGAS